MKKVSLFFKQALHNGTLRHIAFGISGISLIGFLFSLFIESNTDSSLCVLFFFLMVVFLVAGFLLPARRYRKPEAAVPNGSDAYLDQKDTDEFSQEEREALLQESWMAAADRFNRNRRV